MKSAKLLLLPSVWLVLSFVVVDTSDLQTFVVTLAALLAVAISSPFTEPERTLQLCAPRGVMNHSTNFSARPSGAKCTSHMFA